MNDKQSFSHTSKFVDASYCKYWARCKLEGLVEGLPYGANGTFVSINLVSGVLMGSISMLELGLILLRARRPLFTLVRLRALQSFFFTFFLIESKLNLEFLIFDFLLDLWILYLVRALVKLRCRGPHDEGHLRCQVEASKERVVVKISVDHLASCTTRLVIKQKNVLTKNSIQIAFVK